MVRKTSRAAGVLIALGMLAAPAAQADPSSGSTPVATCGTMLTVPGTYGLATNLACGPSYGVTIEGSNIVFFLNGHTIQSDSGAVSIGMYGFSGVVGQDKVEGPGTATGPNPNQDVLVINASDSLVEKVTATGARVGFYTRGNNSNDRFVGDVANGLRQSGLQIQGSGMSLVNNECSNNGYAGIRLTSDIGPSFDNDIVSNTCDNNRVFGVLDDGGSTPNEFHANTAYGNGVFDLADGNPNCGANIWEGNHFATTDQPQCVS
jgi:hypothetical protein